MTREDLDNLHNGIYEIACEKLGVDDAGQICLSKQDMTLLMTLMMTRYSKIIFKELRS